jgi:transposase
MRKQRKHHTPNERVIILRGHLVEGAPISDLCDELGLQPTVFYRWQKQLNQSWDLSAPILVSSGEF